MQRFSAGFLLTIGLIAACIAYGAWSLEATVLDSGRVAGTATHLLDTPAVRDPMSRRVAGALANQGVVLDPGTMDRAVRSTLRDPSFRAAFATAVTNVHDHVFGNAGGRITLSAPLVTTAARHALAQNAPAALAAVPSNAALMVSVDSKHLPHLSRLPGLIGALAWVGGLIALVLVPIGVATNRHPARALARVGRWAIGLGLVQLAAFWLLPHVVMPQFDGWTEVVGVVMSAGDALVRPALGIVAGGGVLVLLGNRWAGFERRHVLAVVPKAPLRRATAAERQDWSSRI